MHRIRTRNGAGKARAVVPASVEVSIAVEAER